MRDGVADKLPGHHRYYSSKPREQDDADDDEGEDAVPVLSDAAAQARLEAVKAAGLLPVCFTVRRGSGGSDAGDASDALPAHLLTVIQVLLMSSEEYGEWEAAGRILLGREYLDDEHLPHVVGALLELAERRLRADDTVTAEEVVARRVHVHRAALALGGP